jgi:hypothetical protein
MSGVYFVFGLYGCVFYMDSVCVYFGCLEMLNSLYVVVCVFVGLCGFRLYEYLNK